MERKLVKDLDYTYHDYNDCGIQKSYSEMDVWYEDGTHLNLVINIVNGPDDYISESEWYIMIANTNNELEMIESIKSRLKTMLEHKWSSKIVYYILNDGKVMLSEK